MNLLRFYLALGMTLACLPRDAAGITTNVGQSWNFAPDAWTRGNDADTAWFGWDVLEEINDFRPAQNLGGFTRILDDNTPDLGVGTTALGPRIYQGNSGIGDPTPTLYGHQYQVNYYARSDFSNDTFTATAPASGIGGNTTVVLQAIGMTGEIAEAMSFEMVDVGWTKAKTLYGENGGSGSGMYWVEWYKNGNDLPFSIHMTSTANHRSFDAFQIDTFWTPESSPRINSISAIPEPGSVLLAGLALIGSLVLVRKPLSSR